MAANDAAAATGVTGDAGDEAAGDGGVDDGDKARCDSRRFPPTRWLMWLAPGCGDGGGERIDTLSMPFAKVRSYPTLADSTGELPLRSE